jgi:flagellar hook-associated protein 1 FlgK
MGNGIYGIGLSGLAAAQAGLLTASHNISNANTPGYSRQVVMLGTNQPQFTGAGFIGSGVNVTTVRRVYDDFLGAQATRAQASTSHLDTWSSELAKLDNLFGDATTGLGPALSGFFSALNTVAQRPADTASRQAALSAAQGLVSRLRQQASQLGEIRAADNGQIGSAVSVINGYATQIAELNRRIGEVNTGGVQPPNDLLDQRDQLVTELNQLVGASVVVQSDGAYNVFLSNGQGLVVGQNAMQLVARPNPDDPQNVEVGLVTGAGVLRFTANDITGGTLGGLLAFRDGPLADAENALGRIAVNVATAVNDQQALGLDLHGSFGAALFATPQPVVSAATTNAGTATVTASIASAGALVASDYRLAFDGTDYSLTRLSDGTTQSFATLPQTVDGVTIDLAGAPAAGDRFLIKPVHQAASSITVALGDPAGIAAAAPLASSASTANVGSATIGPASASATYPASPLGGPVTLTYAAGTATLSGFPATQPVTVTVGATSTTYAAGVPVPYTAGATFSFGGASFTLSGSPANGDMFSIAPNANGGGDNRNAQALAGLADRTLMGNGTATFASAYGQVVAAVGNAAQQADIEHQAQAALLDQTHAAQQALSGVNLDEEAANLQRYQQAYQASSKALAIAGSLFDSILDIMR